MHKYLRSSLIVCCLHAHTVGAEYFTVNSTKDTTSGSGNQGTLRYCIHQANQKPGSVIAFDLPNAKDRRILLNTPMVPIQNDMTIDGNNAPNLVIHGRTRYTPFFVHQGTVSIKNLTLQNGNSKGGNGGRAEITGGGALGAGGASFINQNANVTFEDVNFINNRATGGNAPANKGAGCSGGGGMLQGHGGNGRSGWHDIAGGGGGLAATGAHAPNNRISGRNGTDGILEQVAPGGNGSLPLDSPLSVATGGKNGGGGGSGAAWNTDKKMRNNGTSGGGGGIGGVSAQLNSNDGGNGGDYGGGGGAGANELSGNQHGGLGGFGGGGAGSRNPNQVPSGGFGGGEGGILGIHPRGNGGSALGGTLFLRETSHVVIRSVYKDISIRNSRLITGKGHVSGVAEGTDIYGMLNTKTTFDVGSERIIKLYGAIGGSNTIEKIGLGTLELRGKNSTTQPTQLIAGTLKLPMGSELGAVYFNGTAVLELNGGKVQNISASSESNDSTVNILANTTLTHSISNVNEVNIGATLNLNQTELLKDCQLIRLGNNKSVLNLNAALTLPKASTIDLQDGAMNINNILNLNGKILPTTGAMSVGPQGSIHVNTDGVLSQTTFSQGSTLHLNGGRLSGTISGQSSIIAHQNTSLPQTTANNILIKPNATLTAKNLTTVHDKLVIEQLGTLDLQYPMQGNLHNAGTLLTSGTPKQSLTGNYYQNTGGILKIKVYPDGTSDHFTIDGDASIKDGCIHLYNPNNGSNFQASQTYEVLSTTGTLKAENITCVIPSVLLNVTPRVQNNVLQIHLTLGEIKKINKIPQFTGLSEALDTIIASPDEKKMPEVFAALDRAETAEQTEDVLSSLIQEGVNGGLTQLNVATVTLPMERIQTRLITLRLAHNTTQHTGYVAGDDIESEHYIGPIILHRSIHQKTDQSISGYHAKTIGAGLMADTKINEQMRIGAVASYSDSLMRRRDETGSTVAIGNTQATLYTALDHKSVFVDLAAFAAKGRFRGHRVIPTLNKTARSSYSGIQFGGNARLGFIMPMNHFTLSPMASIRYVHLRNDPYTESGADDANLTVMKSNSDATQLAVGGNIAQNNANNTFSVEAHALYLYDLKRSNSVLSATFVNGGPIFGVSNIITPPKKGVNAGASFTAYFNNRTVALTGSYDLDYKRTLQSHTTTLKLKCFF